MSYYSACSTDEYAATSLLPCLSRPRGRSVTLTDALSEQTYGRDETCQITTLFRNFGRPVTFVANLRRCTSPLLRETAEVDLTAARK